MAEQKDNYFQEDSQPVVDYFEESMQKRPKRPVKAAEMSTIAALLTNQQAALDDDTQMVSEYNLLTLGGDPTVSQAERMVKDELKSASMQAGKLVVSEDEDVLESLASIDEQVKSIDRMSGEPLLKTIAAEALASPDKDFSDLFSGVLNSTAVENELSNMLAEAEENVDMEFLDWVELFTISPVTERTFRGEVLGKLGIGTPGVNYAFRAPHAEMVVQWIRNAPSVQDQKDRTKLLIDTVMQSGDNGIYSLDMLEQVRNNLDTGSDSAALDDLLEAFVIADIKDIGRGLKYLATKALNVFSKGGIKRDAKAISDAEEVVKDVVDSFVPTGGSSIPSPRMNPVALAVGEAVRPQRGMVGSTMDNLYIYNPETVGSLITETNPQNLTRILNRSGITPEELSTRFSPANGYEGRGMHMSWLTGADSGSYLVSKYDNIDPQVVQQWQALGRRSMYTGEELANAADRVTESFRRSSNGVLQPQMTRIARGSEETDVLEVQSLFGKTKDKGYKSIQEAEYALGRLIGADNGEILARRVGTKDQPVKLGDLGPRPHPRFSEEAMRYARNEANTFNPKERLISLTPQQFLKLAKRLDTPSAAKLRRLEGVSEFDDVPYLKARFTKSGNLKIIGHEGRHRAIKLTEEGVKDMPVRIRIEGKYWSKVEELPKHMLGEDAGKIKFPSTTWDESPEGAEYFVSSTSRTPLVPMDANPFGENIWGGHGMGLTYVLPYSNRISEEMFNKLAAVTGRSGALASSMLEMFKPIRKVKGKQERNAVNSLLVHGDENGLVFTKQSANQYLGGQLNDRIWNAYKASREFFDFLWHMENQKEFVKLSAEGMKTLRAGDTVISDSKGALFGRPVMEGEFKSADVDAVLDEAGNVLEYTDDLYSKVVDEGGTILRLNREATNDRANYYNYMVIRDVDSIKPLTVNPLPRRTGHVDLRYLERDPAWKQLFGFAKAGGTGYVVRSTRDAIIDGKAGTRNETIAIVGTKTEAEDWIASNADEFEDVELSVVPTRETRSEIGLTDATNLSGVPVHSLGRGQRLYGPKGLAEVQDPLESLEAAMGSVRGLLNTDVLDYYKSKFIAEYAEEMGDTPRFPANADEAKQLGVEAEKWYEWIRSVEDGLYGKTNGIFFDSMRRQAHDWINSGDSVYAKLGEITNISAGAMEGSVKLLSQLNVLTTITGRMLYQIVGNASQSIFMLAESPRRFIKNTAFGGISVMSGLLLKSGRLKELDTSKAMNVLGKSFGMTGDQFDKYLDDMMNSGMFEISIMDDLFSYVLDSTKATAGDMNMLSANFWKKLPSRGVIRPLTMLPEQATKFNNMMAYVHSTFRQMQDKGATVDDLFSTKVKNDIKADADRYTFTQNRVDMMPFQQNALMIPFQFVHHPWKMFMNTFLSPYAHAGSSALRVPFGGAKLSDKVSRNIYASTRAQALITFGMTLGMFGIDDLIPEQVSAGLRTNMAEAGVPQPLITALLDGAFNVGFEEWWGETFNISSRFSGADMPKQVLDFFFNEDGSVNILGPSQLFFKNLVNIGDIIRTQAGNEKMSSEEFYDRLSDETLNMFASYRDWERAMIVRNLGLYITSDGRQISEVNPDAWGAVALSLAPKSVENFWTNEEYLRKERELADKVVDSMLRAWIDWSKDNVEATSDEVSREMVRMMQTYGAIFQNNPEMKEYSDQRFMTRLLDRYEEPAVKSQIIKLFSVSSNKDEARKRIEAQLQQYPEWRDDPAVRYILEDLRQE